MFMSLSAIVLFTPVSSENISRVVTFVLFVSCIAMHSSRMCFWVSSVWPVWYICVVYKSILDLTHTVTYKYHPAINSTWTL